MGDQKTRQCSMEEASSTQQPGLKKSMSEWQFSPSLVLEQGLPIDPETKTYIRPNVKVSCS